ncbi:hypothetical protein CORT_0B01560 [Candida orthopsilosis Co 90-125]|uniref:Uncharacterized protein n=1 Tax=Candida orthopsilosis (strain 90-125) TaxID=1136231 RepID=H8WZK7_CANO9|nr:hypothetical protein CORT_0B01560 [Candida orthopsilosis Co 90-125]CCG21875.1 hypothetical protein CORT_0B01560 [Candida orthopsilosis Co 90-125]
MSTTPNEILNDISKLLKVRGIDESTLSLCYKLLDEGVDPRKLAEKIKDIQKEISL